MNWAKEVAMRIIEERPNEEVYTVASGVSPSGFVHIGNFREIATPYLVAKELRKLGKKVRYILSFDEGYNTHVNEYLFSQGQRQLLSIARAIVTNPPILLLDEMTANLDLDTEDKIITVLKNASKDRTVLSISHRLSSKLISDRVILLEDKGIINYESAN